MAICDKCNHEAWCCRDCGLCCICGAGKSILAPHLCEKCACDPVLPEIAKVEWWKHSFVDGVRFSELGGSEGRSFLEAWNNASQYFHERVWDHLTEKELNYYHTDIHETLCRLQEHFEFSDTTLEKALASDDPIDELVRLLLSVDDDDESTTLPTDEVDHGIIESEDEIENWLSEEASFSIELLFDEDLENAENDMEVARILGLAEINKESFLSALSKYLQDEKRWDLVEDIENILAAQAINPEKIETNFSTYSFDEILGLCTSCRSPITKDDFGKENREGRCRYCEEKLNLRLCYLMLLFITGQFFVPPDIFCDPQNEWVLWPIEIQAKFTDKDVVG